MAESFILTVHYNNTERHYVAELKVLGYTHKIVVNVDETKIIFEPDEERNYRAVLQDNDTKKKNVDIALLKKIAHELEETFKLGNPGISK